MCVCVMSVLHLAAFATEKIELHVPNAAMASRANFRVLVPPVSSCAAQRAHNATADGLDWNRRARPDKIVRGQCACWVVGEENRLRAEDGRIDAL